MDLGRVKDRQRHIGLVDEQRDLGATEDEALHPFIVDEPVDDPDITLGYASLISFRQNSSKITR